MAEADVWILVHTYLLVQEVSWGMTKEKSRNKPKKVLGTSQYTSVRPGFFPFLVPWNLINGVEAILQSLCQMLRPLAGEPWGFPGKFSAVKAASKGTKVKIA